MSKQTIGEFLATQRKAKGYTQQYVADMLGISNRTLSAWETNKAFPDILTLPALAELYGVTADEIINGERNVNVTVNETEISEKSQNKLYKSKLARNSTKNTVLLSAGICSAVAFSLGLTLTDTVLWLSILITVIAVLAAVTVFTMLVCSMKFCTANFSDTDELTVPEKNYILNSIKQIVRIIDIISGVWLGLGVIIGTFLIIFGVPPVEYFVIFFGISAALVLAILIAANCYKNKIAKKYAS